VKKYEIVLVLKELGVPLGRSEIGFAVRFRQFLRICLQPVMDLLGYLKEAVVA
jgi:hypothetical protein